MRKEELSTEFSPTYVSPPGETIEDLLDDAAMTQADLAKRLGVSTKHLNQVVKGVAPISADLALGLEMVFDVPADFWMTREAIYRTRLAKQRQTVNLEEAAAWANRFPLREMKKRGLIPTGAGQAELTEALLKFLGVAGPDQWSPPAVAYRKSAKLESDSYALSAWLRLGEIEAQKQSGSASPFDAERFRAVLDGARGWTRLPPPEWQPKLAEACATAGVIVVIAEHFKDAKVNGATRWLTPDKALIQLSLRYRWEDVFWFTFFHEAGHVLKHRKKALFIETDRKPERSADPELARAEAEADRFAANTLIPTSRAAELTTLRVTDIPGFAAEIGVSPAIVVGRMHHDRLLPFNRGNHLRERFVFA